MITGILINARLSSTRLPRKHLIKINNITVIEILVKRLLYFFNLEIKNNNLLIIINTSNKKENYEFDELFNKYDNVNVYHGNDENIPYRQLRCAEKFNLDKIINICGDNILISMNATKKIYYILNQNTLDVIKTIGLPIGLNVAGYTYEYLKKSLLNISENQKLETGWYSVFNKMNEIKMGDYTLESNLRFTMDYPEDAIFITKVIEYFDNNIFSVSDKNIFEIVIDKKFYLLNNHLKEKYWNNFNNNKH